MFLKTPELSVKADLGLFSRGIRDNPPDIIFPHKLSFRAYTFYQPLKYTLLSRLYQDCLGALHKRNVRGALHKRKRTAVLVKGDGLFASRVDHHLIPVSPKPLTQ